MFQRIKKFINKPGNIVLHLAYRGMLTWMPDDVYLKIIYRIRMGKKLNLNNPKSFSEKLQWLKLYDRNKLYTKLVDKYEVKNYVASIIGEQYVIKNLGVWEKFEDIDFDRFPKQFVLKCTHDSGGIVIVKDKAALDINKAREILQKSQGHNYYHVNREWPYKNVKPRIIAEEYMEDSKTGELRDYKFFAFDGVVKAMFIAKDRSSETEETKFDFFDDKYNHLPFINGHPNADEIPEKPLCFDEMKKLAEKLSKGIPHVRVDFYEVNGRVYFGEMTFYHWSGMVPFNPQEWDEIFGSWIRLPSKNK